MIVFISILILAFMHQSNSSINGLALFSIASASTGIPFSSYWLLTLATGYIAGTIHAPIFHKLNTSEVVTWLSPNGPLETLASAIGFLLHSAYKRSITFFRLAG